MQARLLFLVFGPVKSYSRDHDGKLFLHWPLWSELDESVDGTLEATTKLFKPLADVLSMLYRHGINLKRQRSEEFHLLVTSIITANEAISMWDRQNIASLLLFLEVDAVVEYLKKAILAKPSCPFPAEVLAMVLLQAQIHELDLDPYVAILDRLMAHPILAPCTKDRLLDAFWTHLGDLLVEAGYSEDILVSGTKIPLLVIMRRLAKRSMIRAYGGHDDGEGAVGCIEVNDATKKARDGVDTLEDMSMEE